MGTTRHGADRAGPGSRTVAGRDGAGAQQLLAFAQGAGNQAFGAMLGRQTLARQEDGGSGYEASPGDGGGGGGGYEAAPAGGESTPAGGGAGPTGPPAGWETPGDGASTGGSGYEQTPAETHSEIQPAPETQGGDWKDQPTDEEAAGKAAEGAAVELNSHAKKAQDAAQQAEASGHPQVAQALRETAESLRAHAGNLAGGNGSGDLLRVARETEARADDAQRSGAPRELVEAVRQSARDARAAASTATSVSLQQRGGGPPAIQ